MIRVLVVDDHRLVCEGVRRLFASTADLRVEAMAADGEQALRQLESAPFDVVVLDLHLGEASGLQVLDVVAARWPRMSVLVLTLARSPEDARAALERGALGFVTKGGPSGELLLAARRVARGDRYVCAALSGAFTESAWPAPRTRPAADSSAPPTSGERE